MGIANFTLLLQTTPCKPVGELKYFDAILVDIQSVLYSKLSSIVTDHSFTEQDIILSLCRAVTDEIGIILQSLLQYEHDRENVTVVISFDGAGIPMKWPQQCERRVERNNSNSLDTQKAVLLNSLFEHNTTSKTVSDYLIKRLTDSRWFIARYLSGMSSIPLKLSFVVMGSNVKGEGEHKLFHMAEKLKLQHVVIVSIDNDVFVIAFLRNDEFCNIQICKRYDAFYDLSVLEKDVIIKLVYASFLFGNDFIPVVVQLLPTNVLLIHEILRITPVDFVHVVHNIVSGLAERKKIHFERTQRDYKMLVEFWKNCFWILDYYRKKEFPQKYIENHFYNMYVRDVLLFSMLDFNSLKNAYHVARNEYDAIRSTESNMESGKEKVFEKDVLEVLNPYFLSEDQSYVTEIEWKTLLKISVSSKTY